MIVYFHLNKRKSYILSTVADKRLFFQNCYLQDIVVNALKIVTVYINQHFSRLSYVLKSIQYRTIPVKYKVDRQIIY